MISDLNKATYGEVKKHKYQFAVLPWGAIEPHNYHLPYLTDCYLSYSIAIDAVNKALSKYGIMGMVLPSVPFGSQNPGQRELPFCIHTRYETQKNILTDVVESLDYQGIYVLVIINGHGGNSFKNMIRDLAIDYSNVLIACCDWFTVEPQSGYFENKDDHAGEMETSVMMHYYPGLVDLLQAGKGDGKPFNVDSLNNKIAWIPRNWGKVSSDTGIGNPEKSSAEKGKIFAEVVTDKIALLFNDLVNGKIYLE